MGREIKFRAWNITKSKWQEFTWPFGTLVGGNAMDELKLMQYTGLKDKNGTEIYEGDIVEVTENIKTSGRVQDDGSTLWNIIDAGLQFEVGWNDLSPSWHLYPVPLDDDNIDIDRVMTWLWDSDGGSECLEVIGNIYENPELIK